MLLSTGTSWWEVTTITVSSYYYQLGGCHVTHVEVFYPPYLCTVLFLLIPGLVDVFLGDGGHRPVSDYPLGTLAWAPR